MSVNRPVSNRVIPDLPARYYLDHFNEFIEVIESRYGHVLEPVHSQWIADFRRLSGDAQCLYLRMLNRRGQIFDSRKLRYQEISDIQRQMMILRHGQFVRHLQLQDFADWLNVITRQTLQALLEQQCSQGSFRRSWPKSALVDFALQKLCFHHHSIDAVTSDYVVQSRQQPVAYLLFLYFGRFEQDLSRFTLRDLGVVRASKFSKNHQARFAEKSTALNSWFYHQKKAQLGELGPDQFQVWADGIDLWPAVVDESTQLVRQKVIHQIGEKIEKYGEHGLAEIVYRKADGWPSSERLVRIVYAKGEKERAASMLEQMIDDPSCDDELLFSKDFYQRKFNKKRTSQITDILRNSKVIRLDECYRNSAEQGAVAYFRHQGAEAFHSENRIWKRLFGLVFWKLLFHNDQAAIYNEFERKPVDLETGEFYQRFKQAIEHTLDQLADTDKVLRHLLGTVTREYGNPNAIFIWHPDMLDEIRALLRAAPADAIASILRRMATDYAGNHSGFPDLLVIKDGVARFIEIKAEGDQLRRNQLKQIVALEQAGLGVEVNRVEWMVDPAQSYVVVDIETTGRRVAGDCITEIAAVKVVNNEIVDQWQSLLNPGRPIPPGITALTGISNEMVRDAPIFCDMADGFSAFCEGSVFVAHNVRFDYSFIGDAFRRLDRPFQMPLLCTCVEMRKWYPGNASYSLKNLCDTYEIELTSHHRAMCDALAATELLKMINSKRIDAGLGNE